MAKTKPRKCKACPKKFLPRNSTQVACSFSCAVKIGKERAAKKAKREHLDRKKKYYDNDLGHQKKKAKTICHKYIRYRDQHLPCISCGKQTAGQWDAGHYKTRGAKPELQFHEWNINRECSVCNNYRSAHDGHHREELINRIGVEAVEFLEGPQTHHKWTVEDYKDVQWWYTEKLKWLTTERAKTMI